MKKSYFRMWSYVRPYKSKAIIAILLTIPVGSFDAVIAWSLKPFMDSVLLTKASGITYFLPLLIIFVSISQSLFGYMSQYLNSWVGMKVTNDLKNDLFNVFMQKESEFFDERTSGDIQMRFNADADRACSGLLEGGKLFFTRLFSSLALTGVLLYNSWQLAIVSVLILAFAIYPMNIIRKRIKKLTKATLSSVTMVVNHYNEAFSGNRVISSFNLQQEKKYRFSKTLNDVFKLSMKTVKKTGLLTPVMHFLTSLGIAAVIYIGQYLIISGQLSPGGFISFLASLMMLYQPLKKLGTDVSKLQIALLSMERVFSILDDSPKIVSKSNAKLLEGVSKKICFNNVSFSYSTGRQVLNDVSLEIQVGQKVAFVGASGGGKSTLVNLIPRFYDVDAGSITIDGVDIRDYDLNSLRENISIVFQDDILFSGTIRENIIVGKKNATKREVTNAIKNACLDSFLSSLPKGIDTEIGERGILLSGGQKQRIAIARAFLKDAPIVILDEATSALDNKSEAIVQQAIFNLMKKRTVLIVAHRLTTIKNADNIVVINNGVIAETGNHDDLITNSDSFYYSLHKRGIA